MWNFIVFVLVVCVVFILFYYYVSTSPAKTHLKISPQNWNNLLKKQFTILPNRVLLRHGYTRYNFLSSSDNSKPLVVCLHGISSFSYVWTFLCQKLHADGHDVLTFDFYGRGYSDTPDVPYNADLYCGQIEDLLQAINQDKRMIYLIGHSVRSKLTWLTCFDGRCCCDSLCCQVSPFISLLAYLIRHHDKIAKLILIAPAGCPVSVTNQLSIKVAKSLPLIIDALVFMLLPHSVRNPGSAVRHSKKRPDLVEFYTTHSREMLDVNPGFVRAYLSTVRNFPLTDLAHHQKKIGDEEVETLILWGREDLTIPSSNVELFQKRIPHAKVTVLEDTGHLITLERKEEVYELISKFIKE